MGISRRGGRGRGGRWGRGGGPVSLFFSVAVWGGAGRGGGGGRRAEGEEANLGLRATNWRANQLRYTHHTVPEGGEPPTHGEGRCSIRLGYRKTQEL